MNIIQYSINHISIDKIIETTASLLLGLLFAFVVWLLKSAYENRNSKRHLIAEIERVFVYNNATLADYVGLLDVWREALRSHQGYTARFSSFNLGKDIKTTTLDLKFVNKYLPAIFSLDRLESDIANLYERYSNTATILINREVQTQEQLRVWHEDNDHLLKVIDKIYLEVPKIQEQVLEVIAYSRILDRQSKFSVFRLTDFLNINIYPKLLQEKDIKEQKEKIKEELREKGLKI